MSRKPWQYWPPEVAAQAEQMRADGMGFYEIAAALGRTYESVRNKLRPRERERAETVRRVVEYAPPQGPELVELYHATVDAPDESRDETEEEFLARVFQSATKSVEKAKAQKHATLKIASSEPVGIAFLGDQHIDTKGTDLRFLERTAKFIGSTPGLYGFGLGDVLQNNIVHRDKDVRALPDQLRFFDCYLGWMLGKFLMSVDGNHDAWTQQVAGFDHIKAAAKRHKFHYAPDEMLVTVQIVNPHDADEVTAEWTIAARHQFRRHSNLNPLHACWRWMEEQAPNWDRIPDVLVLAHNHAAAVGVHNFAGRDVWGIRPGSAQIDSNYARQKGFQDFRPTAPVAVLPAVQSGRVQCFADPEAAVQHMRGWRDVAA
jgi:hypothetical protein